MPLYSSCSYKLLAFQDRHAFHDETQPATDSLLVLLQSQGTAMTVTADGCACHMLLHFKAEMSQMRTLHINQESSNIQRLDCLRCWTCTTSPVLQTFG